MYAHQGMTNQAKHILLHLYIQIFYKAQMI